MCKKEDVRLILPNCFDILLQRGGGESPSLHLLVFYTWRSVMIELNKKKVATFFDCQNLFKQAKVL
ncbi:MAG: hypothetical protein CSA35_00225 [Dethiosulfovibrio peptidovorans]|nr:MAG: hypothetical protein CSA35_00225 [Dethiosulfovibrio peptidovorans]